MSKKNKSKSCVKQQQEKKMHKTQPHKKTTLVIMRASFIQAFKCCLYLTDTTKKNYSCSIKTDTGLLKSIPDPALLNLHNTSSINWKWP